MVPTQLAEDGRSVAPKTLCNHINADLRCALFFNLASFFQAELLAGSHCISSFWVANSLISLKSRKSG